MSNVSIDLAINIKEAERLVEAILTEWKLPYSDCWKIFNNGTSGEDYLFSLNQIIGMDKMLKLIFPENPELAMMWMTLKNSHFENKRPVDVILTHLTGATQVYNYLLWRVYE